MDMVGDLTAGSPDGAGPADLGGNGPDMHVPDRPDLSKLVPWKAVALVGPTDHFWEEYDYRPRAQGGFREDIDATLERMRGLGVRQVEIQTLFAWSAEDRVYPGTQIRSIVYYDPAYKVNDPKTWGKVPRTRRGDMGLMPFLPPPSWDVPTPLRTPLDIGLRAQQALGDMLDAVAAHGLFPVLKCEDFLLIAQNADDYSGDFNYTDPSRNFDQFYSQYKSYLLDMTKVAAQHHAVLLVLGSETPYVTGAGIATFADGSAMTSRHALIAAKWQDMIQAVRDAAKAAGRPDLALSYTEINPWYDPRAMDNVPVWARVPFWDQLDAVGINFYLPGRYTDGMGMFDTSPPTTAAMVKYGETHTFQSDIVPNFQDLKDYFYGQRGYRLMTKPVIFPEDGCTSTKYGAANPADPPLLTLRAKPDFAEQADLYEAHFQLAAKYGSGWLAGFGFWQVTPTSRWGGAYNPGNTTNYSTDASYFGFVGTPTEDIVRTYFAKY